jgi:hypothetical protein
MLSRKMLASRLYWRHCRRQPDCRSAPWVRAQVRNRAHGALLLLSIVRYNARPF